MKKRIEFEMENSETDDNYIQRQRYFLKKINENQKANQRKNGIPFYGCKLIHCIGTIKDNISSKQIRKIANGYIEEANFGFDDSELAQYVDYNFPRVKNPFGFFALRKPIMPLPEGRDASVTKDDSATVNNPSHFDEVK